MARGSTIVISGVVNLLIIVAVILFTPGLPPNVKYDAFKIPPLAPLEGTLRPNNILDKSELFLSGKFVGSESIAIRKNEIYTGVEGGRILRISPAGEITTIATIVGDCGTELWKVGLDCGRPLGVRFDGNGKLIIADAYFGLYRLDVDTGKLEQIVSTEREIEGKRPLLPDDVDIGKDGNIYWSDASTVATLRSSVVEYFGSGSGRLIKTNPENGKSEVLIDNLHFPNGVQLSSNQDFVLVAETMRARIWRYFLKGERKGKAEVFIDNLPGLPDNIRPTGRGGYYISLCVIRTPNLATPGELLGRLPLVRKLILRLHGLVNLFLSTVHHLTGRNQPLEKFIHNFHHVFAPSASSFPRKVIIVEISESGEIIGSLQDSESPMEFISETSVGDEFTYFGSFTGSNLYRIKTQVLHNIPK